MSGTGLGDFHREKMDELGYFHNEKDIKKPRIIKFMSPFIKDAESICDIGARDCHIIKQLDIKRKVGVDISLDGLGKVDKDKITPVVFNIDSDEPFPFADGEFDVLCSFDTLEHCMRTDHILNEINRITKDGGMFFLSVPNINQLVTLLFYFMDFPPACSARYRSNHYRDFTHRLIRNMLKIHGFEIVKNEGSHVAPFTNGISRAIAKWFPRFGAHLMYAARKVKTVSIDDGYTGTTKQIKQFFKDNT